MRYKILPIVVAIILMISIFSNSYGKNFETSNYEKLEKFLIIYDEDDLTTQDGAEFTYSVISKHYENIELKSIDDYNDLQEILSEELKILIYFFHGSDEGLYINHELVEWKKLGCFIENSNVKWHIIESCFSQNMQYFSNVYGIGNEVDVELCKIHVLESLINIYIKEDPYNEIIEDITQELSDFITNNLENLIDTTINPKNPMVEQAYDPEDPPVIKENTQKEGYLIVTPFAKGTFSGAWGWILNALVWAANKVGMLDVIPGEGGQLLSGLLKDGIKSYKVGKDTKVGRPKLGTKDKKGNDFNFNIPYLDFDLKPSFEKGNNTWYAPERVKLDLTVAPDGGKIDLGKLDGLKQLIALAAAEGIKIGLVLKPKIHAGVVWNNFSWFGRYTHNETGSSRLEALQFLGAGWAISLLVEVQIPVTVVLNKIVPGAGTAIAKTLEILGIEANVIFSLEFGGGMDYDGAKGTHSETTCFQFLVGLLIKGGLPSPATLIKKAIGVKIPLPVELGFKLRGDTGFAARTISGSSGSLFQIGLPFSLLLEFWAAILWIFKFSWGNEWEKTFWFPDSDSYSDPEIGDSGYGDGTNVDTDGDGLSDLYEKEEVTLYYEDGSTFTTTRGLNYTNADTDGDGLFDGNELVDHFTDPVQPDSDGDNLTDKEEIEYWLIDNQLDYMVDYDNDKLPCLLDRDSDDDFLKDGGTEEEVNCCIYTEECRCSENYDQLLPTPIPSECNCPPGEWDFPYCCPIALDDEPGERTFGTDPSVSDTDGDGLLDGEEITFERFNYTCTECYEYPPDWCSCKRYGVAGWEYIYDDWGNCSCWGKREGQPYSICYSHCQLNEVEYYDCNCIWDPTYLIYCATDPLKKDTDDDGLIDGIEREYFSSLRVDKYRFSPVNNSGPYEDYDGDCIINIIDPDSDNDGLLDGEEVKYGTDPLNQDTDGDCDVNGNRIVDSDEIPIYYWNCGDFICQSYGNFSDYWEVNGQYWQNYPTWSNRSCPYPDPTPTNPLKNDSDDDGMNDFEEWENGTCPVLLDSDGDGLTNDEELTLYDTICYDNDTDNDGLLDGFEKDYFIKMGISASDYSTLGSYLKDHDVDDDSLFDGEELLYNTDILDSDTDDDGILDGKEIKKYVMINNQQVWTGFGTNPLISDTDGDGLLDGEEVYDLKTDPLKIDTDGDGLTDYEENQTYEKSLFIVGDIIYKTDPLDPDTDDDTISDSEEVWGWDWAINRILTDGEFPSDSDRLWGKHIEREDEEEPWWTWTTRERVYKLPDPYRSKFETNPNSNDTDGDGILDGEEKDYILSPMTDDTDVDGIPDLDEISLLQNISKELGWDEDPIYGVNFWKQFDIWHYRDFDHDGLDDENETLLFNKYNANAQQKLDLLLFKDADGDNLTDWREVRMPVSLIEISEEDIKINETTGEIYSTNKITAKRYTNPLKIDTDDDGLSDSEELRAYGTNPLQNDSDDDGITDWNETKIYLTDPTNPDTDSDGAFEGWTDGLELEKFKELNITSQVLLSQYLNNPDCDEDGIVDSIEFMNSSLKEKYNCNTTEIKLYSDPLNPDFDGDKVLDGNQTDFDNDGLSDYREFRMPSIFHRQVTYSMLNSSFRESETYDETYYNSTDFDITALYFVNHTFYFINDSDADNITDGDELYNYTDPIDWDTDDDGLDDGFEKEYYAGLRVDKYGFPKKENDGPYEDYDGDFARNIVDFDSDDDGYSDGEEYLNNTDPLNYESSPGPQKEKEKSPGFEFILLLLVVAMFIFYRRRKMKVK